MDFYNFPVDVWSPYYSDFKGLLETGTYLYLRMTVQSQHQRLGESKPVKVVSSGGGPVRGQPWLHEPPPQLAELMREPGLWTTNGSRLRSARRMLRPGFL